MNNTLHDLVTTDPSYDEAPFPDPKDQEFNAPEGFENLSIDEIKNNTFPV